MEKIELGTKVEWKSQAGGVTKKKQGLVVHVVPAGQAAEMNNGDFSIEFDLPAKPRPEESYIVRVENVRKGRAGLYWPPASKLKPIGAPQKAAPPDTHETSKDGQGRAWLLPGIPDSRGPLAKAAENYLHQAARVREEKAKLSLMGQGVMSAMQTEKRLKLTLEDGGESWHFEVKPTGYHLKVSRGKA